VKAIVQNRYGPADILKLAGAREDRLVVKPKGLGFELPAA
jgi:hypothetical protein